MPDPARHTDRHRGVRALAALGCLAGGVIAAGALPAQGSGAAAPDDAAVHRAARRAQRAFEAERRFRLPHTEAHGSGCEVNVGRLCYWDDNDDAPLPPEPVPIATARRRLLDSLTAWASRAPADDWIAGQRVRYALEAADDSAARAAVAGCGGTPWWCAALGGLVAHARGNEDTSARAFDDALRAMPDTLRCAWLDARPWMPPDEAHRAGRADCAEREARAARLFWLAAPLLTWRPQSARDEWLSRRVRIEMLRGTALAEGLAWGDDIGDLGLRFGFPVQWARENRPGLTVDPFQLSIVGLEPRPSWSFVPEARALASPTSARPDDWTLRRTIAPPMRFAPPGLRSLQTMDARASRFRRGSGERIVVASAPSDSLRTAHPVTAAVLAVAPDTVLATARRPRADGALVLDAPPRDALLAVEVVDTTRGMAERWRGGIPPLPANALVSDLLVGIARDSTPPRGLDDVAAVALATPRVPAGATLSLYWEYYGRVSPDHPLALRARLVPARRSFLGRVAHGVGLAGDRTTVAIGWSDIGAPDGSPGRTLRLRLPEAARGKYRLEVEAAGAGGKGTTSVPIEIVGPS